VLQSGCGEDVVSRTEPLPVDELAVSITFRRGSLSERRGGGQNEKLVAASLFIFPPSCFCLGFPYGVGLTAGVGGGGPAGAPSSPPSPFFGR
jgi:hypothetical protein